MSSKLFYSVAAISVLGLTAWACSDDDTSPTSSVNNGTGGSSGAFGADGTGHIDGSGATTGGSGGSWHIDGTGHSDGTGFMVGGSAGSAGSAGGWHIDGGGYIDGSGPSGSGGGGAGGLGGAGIGGIGGKGGGVGGAGAGGLGGAGNGGLGGAGNGGLGGAGAGGEGGNGSGGDGTCGKPCTDPGTVCSEGQCICAGKEPAVCQGQCVDLSVDLAHCGACGSVCAIGEACDSGLCLCPLSNQCNGTCADTAADDKNCGSCGNVCGDGTRCEGGVCRERQILDSGDFGGMYDARIALDGGYIYWSTDIVLRRVKLDGTGAEVISNQTYNTGFAFDDKTIYSFSLGGLVAQDKSTLKAQQLLDASPFGWGLFLEKGALYFSSSSFSIEKLGISPPAPLVTFGSSKIEPRWQFVSDGSHAYWGNGQQIVRKGYAPGSVEEGLGGFAGRYLTLDGDTLFFGREYFQGAGVYSMPKSGGVPKSLLVGRSGPMCVDSTDLFVADGTTEGYDTHSTVQRINKQTGVVTLFAKDPKIRAVAVDEVYLYYVSEGNLIRRKK